MGIWHSSSGRIEQMTSLKLATDDLWIWKASISAQYIADIFFLGPFNVFPLYSSSLNCSHSFQYSTNWLFKFSVRMVVEPICMFCFCYLVLWILTLVSCLFALFDISCFLLILSANCPDFSFCPHPSSLDAIKVGKI